VEEAKLSGGPVLEMGSGTGRTAIPIAQADIPIVAMDNSPRMLEIAKAKAGNQCLGVDLLKFVKGDMRNFSLGRLFPLVIIPFRSFLLLLSVPEQYQALEAIKRHLTPYGRLIFNAFVPDPELLSADPSIPIFEREAKDPTTGHRLLVLHQNRYDNFNQIVNARTIIEKLDRQGKVINSTWRDYQLRYLNRFEALHLLEAAGYRVLDIYGGFDRALLDESSTEMIWVATPS
jgi:ubiquinone/menaquinone biosynthesis C-methylase UbiE